MQDDPPSNVVELRPGALPPANLSPAEALVYIRTLAEACRGTSGVRHVDLTLEGILVAVEKAIGPAPPSDPS